MAAGAAGRPAGTVTDVFRKGAEREAAYRLLENPATSQEELAASAHRAAARRCAAHEYVIVPIDGSSLTLNDPSRRKGLGPVGARAFRAQGVQVMTALALAPDGTPLGILHQQYWIRPQFAPLARRKNCGSNFDRRPRDQRESFRWVESSRRVLATLAENAPGTQPWLQMDRGADCMSMISEAADAGMHVTIRAVHDRRLQWPDGHASHLLLSLALHPSIGTYEIDVPARHTQCARHATM